MSIKLFTVEFEATFTVEIAAPGDMPDAAVRRLVEIHRKRLVEQADPRWQFDLGDAGRGDPEDVQRNHAVVNDRRDGFVLGEDTDWLTESS